MKSYTDLEQSKKLAKILPIETADMYWLNRHIDLTETKYEVFVIDKSNKHIDFFKSYAVVIDNNEIIPCWSLAALLSVIKPINENTYTLKGTLDGGATISFDEITNIMFQEEEIIDAVFEMVVLIKENKKL